MSSELDLQLYRPLKDGRKYDSLIPKSTCERVDSGKGMTDYSVTQMAKLAGLYAWQMQKVAPLLKSTSLQRTCNAIHDFCYNHFQYKADTDVQYLRTPACSWYVRKDGIDCKSYSIIASCILLSLNINHYIRRVRQPILNPDMWTHVYVVVPVDQKTGSLDKGHYVIDGTVAMEYEQFIEKSDTYMSMQHEMLNGPGLRGINLDQVKGWFSGGSFLSCYGGAYDTEDLNVTVGLVVPWFDALFAQINDAIAKNSPELINLVDKLYRNSAQILNHATNTAGKSWNSGCSQKAADGYKAMAVWYSDIIEKTHKPWLAQYFTITYTSTFTTNNAYEPQTRNSENSSGSSGLGFRRDQFGKAMYYNKVTGLVLKPTTTSITKFELTPYVAAKENYTSGNFDVVKALSTLTTVIAVFKNGSSSGSNSGTGTNVIGGGTSGGSGTEIVYETDPSNPANKINAGGGVAGILLLAAGASVLLFGDELFGTTKPATGTAAKRAKAARTTSKRKV